jgi:hypothetical protein
MEKHRHSKSSPPRHAFDRACWYRSFFSRSSIPPRAFCAHALFWQVSGHGSRLHRKLADALASLPKAEELPSPDSAQPDKFRSREVMP